MPSVSPGEARELYNFFFYLVCNYKGDRIPSRKKNVDFDIIAVSKGEERSKKTIS